MPSTADEYRARAAHCQNRANETRDPVFKHEFEKIAEKWNDLAAQEEREAAETPAWEPVAA
jgi:hypothetical protein